MRVAFHTLGCKVNQYETERMKEQFTQEGFTVVSEEDVSDVYIINTCTVTNLADRKSRQYIRRMKKKAPDSVVAVTGCYSQVGPDELIDMPEVDIVTGNGDKNNLINLVKDCLSERKRIVKVLKYEELTGYNDKGIITSMENRTRAYIKIQEGCNRFCSYCLIPYARGTVRSRDPKEIILEAETLVKEGFKEIVLTGINTALYGTETDFFEKYPVMGDINKDGSSGIAGKENSINDSLTDGSEIDRDGTDGAGMEYIIREINNIPGEFRIRLSSLEPTVVNSRYVTRLMKYEKLCPHLHLSLQAGSDKVISLMNRHYTRNEYLDIVRILRENDKGYAITTDIIVGFPGETEEDFLDSLDMVRKVKFSKVHAFKYSKRPGTKAVEMKGHLSGVVKNERSDRLIELSEEISREFFESLIDTTRTVLFEEWEDGLLTGYTDNYIKTYVEGPENLINNLEKVKLTGIYLDGMKGEI